MDEREQQAARVRVALDQIHAAAARVEAMALPALQSRVAFGDDPDEATLRLIASLVAEIVPRHVIEFGCGVTTELLGLLGYDHGRMAITTFEHDPWAARELLFHANPYAINYRWFAFSLCPLVARFCGGALIPVYDDGMVTATVPYPADLIVITGPPRELGGRAGLMYQALTHARPGTVVLLLGPRAEEEAMIDGWARALERHILFSPPALPGRSLAFVVLEPMAGAFTLERPRAQARQAAFVAGAAQ